MTTPADLIAVQRAHAANGRDAALAEVRRRWPMIAENVVERTLERVLAAPVAQPDQYTGHGGAKRDPIGHVRKYRKS